MGRFFLTRGIQIYKNVIKKTTTIVRAERCYLKAIRVILFYHSQKKKKQKKRSSDCNFLFVFLSNRLQLFACISYKPCYRRISIIYLGVDKLTLGFPGAEFDSYQNMFSRQRPPPATAYTPRWNH